MFDTESRRIMRKEVFGLVDNLEQALTLETGITRKYKHILVCGMGASAIGGAIFKDVMYYSSRVSVDSVKTFALPPGEHKNTLLVAFSYSGNTMETLTVYKMAIAQGMDVLAVSHGGKLEEMSLENGNKYIKLGGETIQPRSAIGWFLGVLANIMTDATDVDLHSQMVEMIPRLRGYSEELGRQDSKAWDIANLISDKIPVIYSTSETASVGMRFKNQLNENGKLLAFSGLLPEFNHNELVGWCEDPLRKDFLPIIIVDLHEVQTAKTVRATIDLIRSRGVRPVLIITKGETLLERMIYALMVGDFTSLYVAEIQGKDPCNIDPIIAIKAMLKKEFGE